jgi:hypothetical protein
VKYGYIIEKVKKQNVTKKYNVNLYFIPSKV